MTKYLYTAIIIDSRITELFELVLENFYSKLDMRWNFIIYTTNNNFKFIKELINLNFKKEKKRTIIINLDIYHISKNNYSKIFFCNEFYKNITTEIFLIFQLDSLLSDKYYKNIYNYMHFDYIGSPFFHKNNKYVGCGGLSLRKKSKMIEIINDIKYNTEENKKLPEDLYFCEYPNIKKSSVEEALNFCSGGYFHPISVGMHQTFLHIKEEEKQIIQSHIPKLRELEYKYLNLPVYNNPDENIDFSKIIKNAHIYNFYNYNYNYNYIIYSIIIILLIIFLFNINIFPS